MDVSDASTQTNGRANKPHPLRAADQQRLRRCLDLLDPGEMPLGGVDLLGFLLAHMLDFVVFTALLGRVVLGIGACRKITAQTYRDGDRPLLRQGQR